MRATIVDQMPQKKWLSLHLYYGEPWEAFLTECVDPLVISLYQQNLISQHFFIRYWEQGPHIRLRLKTEHDEKVTQMVSGSVMAYYEKKPSDRPQWDKLDQKLLHPNHSIQLISYQPEIKRYGGPGAIEIAERQFQLSSTTVLQVLNEQEAWNNDIALGIAIQLHLTFAHALGMDKSEARGFFYRVFMNWLPKTYYSPELKDNPEVLAQKRKEVIDAFKKKFTRQKAELKEWVQSIWQAMDNISAIEEPWTEDWYEGMKAIGKNLRQIQQQGELEDPKIFMNTEPVDPGIHELWSIYDSYVHMTNNRLRIMNRDEPYLAYIIFKSLT